MYVPFMQAFLPQMLLWLLLLLLLLLLLVLLWVAVELLMLLVVVVVVVLVLLLVLVGGARAPHTHPALLPARRLSRTNDPTVSRPRLPARIGRRLRACSQ